VDVSGLTTRVEILGQTLDYPILLAPTALQRMVHPKGELATAAGAGKQNTLMILSSSSTTPVEDVARAAKSTLWFQLYVDADRGFTREQVERAQAAGCRALCVTVDSPVWGARNRPDRAGSAWLWHRRRISAATSFPGGKPVTWADLTSRSSVRVPIPLKDPASGRRGRRGAESTLSRTEPRRAQPDTSIGPRRAAGRGEGCGRALVLWTVRRGRRPKALALGASAVRRPAVPVRLCVSVRSASPCWTSRASSRWRWRSAARPMPVGSVRHPVAQGPA
jgi:4-hydroxymandelate oxidase